MELPRILFCDYDGEFAFADTLSKVGYLVDQIRPDSLRAVNVGDHALYLFSFESPAKTKEVLEICERLKAAQLPTPIVILCRNQPNEAFLSHASTSHMAADAYLSELPSEAKLLDTLDEFIGNPEPFYLKSMRKQKEEEETRTEHLSEPEKISFLEERVKGLEEELDEVRDEASALDKALEAQRKFYKPKLKAMLEGQKLQVQSETEQLKVRVAEVEAKLLDREAHIKELETFKKNQKKQIQNLLQTHAKAQQKLRSFYQEKLQSLDPNFSPEEALDDEDSKTELIVKKEEDPNETTDALPKDSPDDEEDSKTLVLEKPMDSTDPKINS